MNTSVSTSFSRPQWRTSLGLVGRLSYPFSFFLFFRVPRHGARRVVVLVPDIICHQIIFFIWI